MFNFFKKPLTKIIVHEYSALGFQTYEDYLHNGPNDATDRTYEWEIGVDIDEKKVQGFRQLLDGNNLYMFTIKDNGEFKSMLLIKKEWEKRRKILESIG